MERFTFAVQDSQVIGKTLSGTVHVYGKVSNDSRRIEFGAGAFAEAIAAGTVESFAYHDETKPLGAQRAGNLRLEDHAGKLTFALDLAEWSYANDLRLAASMGMLGMSFAVGLPWDEERRPGGVTFVTKAPLISVDPVTNPAFAGTAVSLHSAQDLEDSRSKAMRIRASIRNGRGETKPPA